MAKLSLAQIQPATFMSEGKTHFYETELEGAKDLKLSGAKQPAIDAGAPLEFQGREENWSPEHLFVGRATFENSAIGIKVST